MRKSTKIWLLTAASLIVLGGVSFTATACSIGWDFKKFSTVTLETNAHEITESFQNISMNVTTADVTFLPSESGACKVVCYENVKEKHSVTVENGTLTVKAVNDRAWYDYLTVTGDGDAKITVYLPQTEYTSLTVQTDTGDLNIPNSFTFDSVHINGSTSDVEFSASVQNTLTVKVSTGDISLKTLTAGTVDLTVSTGEIEINSVTVEHNLTTKSSTGEAELTNVTCKTYTHSGSSSDVEMKNVIVSEKMHIEVSTGDVEFEGCDAGEIYIKTSTGNVEGSLLTEKDFHADSNTGKVHTPDSKVGGKCEITSSTGNIFITLCVNVQE